MGIWWECGKRNGFAGLVPAQEVGEQRSFKNTRRSEDAAQPSRSAVVAGAGGGQPRQL